MKMLEYAAVCIQAWNCLIIFMQTAAKIVMPLSALQQKFDSHSNLSF